MSNLAPELIVGFLSLLGGAMTGYVANTQKLLLASLEATAQLSEQGNDNSNDAAKRAKGGSSFSQKFAVVTIIIVAFCGLWFAGVAGIPVTYIYEEAGRKFLGVFGSGADKIKSITVDGFAIPPYVKYSVISILNYLFGASVLKLRRP